ncbi:MAG: cytochrome c [Holophaga sp.]|nr:cytochrome c [Holophaga sp.]
MPAWGDRLTDAEIQAIVGFVRSWEPTAPEVAVAARVQGPWRSTTTTQAQTPTAWLQSLDWRIAVLALVAAALGAGMIVPALIQLKRQLR